MAEAVYTLVVQIGRAEGDGLPEDATGGALVLYAPGRDEKTAVNDAVRLLRDAGLAPLDVESHGTLAEQEAEGIVIEPEERALMDQAAEQGAIVVASKEAFYD